MRHGLKNGALGILEYIPVGEQMLRKLDNTSHLLGCHTQSELRHKAPRRSEHEASCM